MAAAVGPSGPDASGRIVCGTPDPLTGIVPAAAVIAGCVPVDLFGGVGTITPEQAAYLTVPLTDRGTDTERIVSLNAQGPFGRLPAGPVWWALGAEYRREGGSFFFDPQHGGGIVGSGGELDLPEVSFSARELYLELRAPLLQGRQFARDLTASAGARWSSFSSFGSHFTWQTGLHWQPAPSWALRGSYARVFRAPNLQELYLRQSAGAVSGFDPCGNDPTPAQRVNCARTASRAASIRNRNSPPSTRCLAAIPPSPPKAAIRSMRESNSDPRTCRNYRLTSTGIRSI